MSGTITETYTLAVSNGNYSEDYTRTQQTTQSADGGGNPGFVAIGTSEEDISFGDVTPRVVIIENLDSTNYVQFGPKSGGSMITFGRVAPGAFSRLELDTGVTLRMKADTASCNCRIRGYSA